MKREKDRTGRVRRVYHDPLAEPVPPTLPYVLQVGLVSAKEPVLIIHLRHDDRPAQVRRQPLPPQQREQLREEEIDTAAAAVESQY